MSATKEQERKALAQIQKIIEGLGRESYIGRAFEGCLDVAEDNISNDFWHSMKQRADKAEQEAQRLIAAASVCAKELENAKKVIARLQSQLEAEQEWHDYEMKENVSQEDYRELIHAEGTRILTDEEAKDILYGWFGFAKEKTTIHRSVPTYQINRHRQLRETGAEERQPAYNATDWNYIRFDCGAVSYELHDDTLRFFHH